jgi:hypothetical protein
MGQNNEPSPVLKSPPPDAAANQRLIIRALEKLLVEEGFNNQRIQYLPQP